MNRAAIILTLALAACQGAEPAGERFTADDEGYSCELPRGWEAHRDRGSTILTSPSETRRTFVVRSIPRPTGAEEATVLRATDTVMDGLPAVERTARRAIDGTVHGARYDLTFVPPGAAERYRRTHVVLFLGDARIVHVIETAPASAPGDDALVTRLVGSFREEV